MASLMDQSNNIEETNISETNINVDSELIDFNSIEYNEFIYQCPLEFGENNLSSNYLQNDVIDKGLLLMYPLHSLCELYFKESRISMIANHKNNDTDEISLLNCSFFVCIGNTSAYNKHLISNLHISNRNKKHLSTNINIQTTDTGITKDNVNLKSLFVDFYKGVFEEDEEASLTKAFDDPKTIHISVFGREKLTGAKNKKKIESIKYRDILIAQATFYADRSNSIFLNWMNVTDNALCELMLHADFVAKADDPNDPVQNAYQVIVQSSIRKQFGVGTFLLLIGQLFHSIVASHWRPIICQVHKIQDKGPFDFYLKNYFLKVNNDHQLVHDQYLYRSNFIINDDENLVWMILFYPLACLLNTDICNKNDRLSFKKILIRGYYHFLNHFNDNKIIFDQSKIYNGLKKVFNTDDFMNNPPNVSIDISNEKKLGINENTIHSDDKIMKEILKHNEQYENLITIKDVGSGPDEDDGSCMFLCVSKVIYGTSSYYRGIRQFFYYLYKNISLLGNDHDYFSNDLNVTFLNDLASRSIDEVIDDDLPEIFRDTNQDEITPEICKYYFRLYSSSFLFEEFWGSVNDLSILTSIYQQTFNILLATAPLDGLVNNNCREWKLSFNSTDNGNEYIRSYVKNIVVIPPEYGTKWMCLLMNKHYILLSDQLPERENFHKKDMKVKNNYGNRYRKSEIITVETPIKKRNIVITPPIIIESNSTLLQKQFNQYVSDLAYSNKIITLKSKTLQGEHREIGPMFSYSELSNNVDVEFLMPITRSLMPLKNLIDNGITPFGDGLNFEDLLKYRPDTWISESSTKPFVEWLNSLQNVNYVFIDPRTFNDMIQKRVLLNKKIVEYKLRIEKKKNIVILFTIQNHYIVVEIHRKDYNDVDTNEVMQVSLACSSNCPLEDLSKELDERHLFLFLKLLLKNINYNLVLATHVDQQDSITPNDCGIFCLRRMYLMAKFNVDKTFFTKYNWDAKEFRLCILNTIFRFKKNCLSEYIYNKLNKLNANDSKDKIVYVEDDIIQKDMLSFISEQSSLNLQSSDHLVEQDEQEFTDALQTIPDEDLLKENMLSKNLPIITQTLTSENLIMEDVDENHIDQVNDDDKLYDVEENNNPLKDLEENANVSEDIPSVLEDIPSDQDTDDDTLKDIPIDQDIDDFEDNLTLKTTNKNHKSSSFIVKKKTNLRFDTIEDINISTSDSGIITKVFNTNNVSNNQNSRKETLSRKSLPHAQGRSKSLPHAHGRSKSLPALDTNRKIIHKAPKKKFKITIPKKQVPTINGDLLLGSKVKNLKNSVDLYRDDKYHFVNQHYNVQNDDPNIEIYHNEEKYKGDMFEPWQINLEKAEERINIEMKQEIEKCKEEIEVHKKTIIKINADKDISSQTRKAKLQKVHTMIVKCNEKICLADWDMKRVKIFVPQDSIYAIKVISHDSKSKRKFDEVLNNEYHAVVKNPSGNGYTIKLISPEFVRDNFKEEFLSKLLLHHKEKGWVIFDDNDNTIKTISNEQIDTHNLKAIYEYKPTLFDDPIIIIKCVIQFEMYTKVELKHRSIEWYILTNKNSLSTTNQDRKFPKDILETNRQNKRMHDSHYYHITKDDLEAIIGSEHLHMLQLAAYSMALGERYNKQKLAQERSITYASDFNKQDSQFLSSRETDPKSKSNSKIIIKPNAPPRFYDELDFDEKGKHNMPLQHVGSFDKKQVYYFKMDLYTKGKPYYINRNTEQINGMYWNTETSQFFGLVKNKEHQKHVILDHWWVNKNFDKNFIKSVQKQADNEKIKFCKVPIGLSKPQVELEELKNNPITIYQQNERDTCVFASISSALHYMNYCNVAIFVNHLEDNYVDDKYANNYQKIIGILNYEIMKMGDKIFQTNYQLVKIKTPNEFNIIEEAMKHQEDLFHVVIKGEDCSENHCIAIINKWIFDGNYVNALPLTQASLDECINNKFVGIQSGYRYFKRNNKTTNQVWNQRKIKFFDNTTIITSFIMFLNLTNFEKSNTVKDYFHNINYNEINEIGQFIILLKSIKSINTNEYFHEQRIKDISKFDIFGLSEEDNLNLYHIIIYSYNKKVCICLHNKLIFMNDEINNLELSQQNINLCLDGIYRGTESGYQFIFGKKVVYNQVEQTVKIFDNTTIVTSFIILLQHINFEISNNLKEYFHTTNNDNQIKDISSFMKLMTSIKSINALKNFKSYRMKDIINFDIFGISEIDELSIYQIIIYSNNKKVCVCLHNRLIYMNNEVYNLELNQHNINLCLDGVYEGIEIGYQHVFLKNESITNNDLVEGTIYLDYTGTT